VGNHAGQINRRFNAGVATTNHRHTLALEQRAIAVRAVGNTAAAVFLLAGDVHFAPAGAGGNQHGFALQHRAIGEMNFTNGARHQLCRALVVHDVNVVGLDVLLKSGSQFRTIGFVNGNKILDRHGVEHLATETLGQHASVNTLAGGINRCSSTGRATADDKHVKSVLAAELFRITLCRAAVGFRQDFFQRHPALAEGFAVQQHGRHRHDLTGINLVLKQGTINHGVAHARVQCRHQVQCLNHVRAVVTAQGNVGFEVEFTAQTLDLLDDVRLDFRRVTGHLQQGQHQRGKFMAHGQAGKVYAGVFAGAVHGKGRLADIGVVAVTQADLVGQRNDVFQQRGHFPRLVSRIGIGHQLDRVDELFKVSTQLCFQIGIKHGPVLFLEISDFGVDTHRRFWRRCKPASGSRTQAVRSRLQSDLANQIERRCQGGFAFFPLGRADFARVCGNVLGRFDFAQQLGGIAADATGVDFDDLDRAGRINHEGATLGQACFLDHHFEVARDQAGRITDHRVLDFLDGVGGVVPCLVGEMGVGGNAVDFHAHFFELGVVVGQVAQLGRADKGKVRRVEEHHRPLALQLRVGNVDKFTVVVCGGLERLHFSVDQVRHVLSSLVCLSGIGIGYSTEARMLGAEPAEIKLMIFTAAIGYTYYSAIPAGGGVR